MKYTICGFQQDELVAIGFDSNDAVMLRWFVDFSTGDKMYNKIKNNRIYFWVLYKKMIEDLPILKISKPESIADRLKKWEKAGLVTLDLVKGVDEYFCNGRSGVRNGTFTYFAFNSELLGVLLGDRVKTRTLTEAPEQGVGSKPEPGAEPNPKRGRVKTRTKDTSLKDPSIIDYSSSDKNEKIKFVWEEWEFLNTGFVLNTITGKEYPVRKFPFANIEINKLIDKHYPLY